MVAGGAGNVGKGVFSGVRHVVPHHNRRSTMTSVITADGTDDGYSLANASGTSMAPINDGSAHTGAVNGTVSHSPIGGGSPEFGNLQITVHDVGSVQEKEKTYVAGKQFRVM